MPCRYGRTIDIDMSVLREDSLFFLQIFSNREILSLSISTWKP